MILIGLIFALVFFCIAAYGFSLPHFRFGWAALTIWFFVTEILPRMPVP